MTDNLPVSGPLSLGDILDRTFRIYRVRFTVLVLTAAVFLVPLGIVTGAATGRFMVTYTDLLQGLATTTVTSPVSLLNDYLDAFLGIAGVGLFIGTIGLIANGLVTLAATTHVIYFLEGSELTFIEGLRLSVRRFWSLLGLYVVRAIAIGLATIAVAVLVGIFAFAVIFVVAGSTAFLLGETSIGDAGPGEVLGLIGFVIVFLLAYFVALLLIALPGLYLSARWLVAIPSLVDDKLPPVAALRRSWHLSKGYTIRCAGYVLLLSLLSLLVVSLPLSVFQQIFLLLVPIPEAVSYALASALASIFNIVWYPLYAAGMVMIYYDLRVRREGYDLDLRVRQLESQIKSEAQENSSRDPLSETDAPNDGGRHGDSPKD